MTDDRDGCNGNDGSETEPPLLLQSGVTFSAFLNMWTAAPLCPVLGAMAAHRRFRLTEARE